MLTSRMDRNRRLITSLEKRTWTSRTYREAVLKQIQNMVPYEAYCFTTVDPQTLLSTGAVTEDGIEAIHDRLFVNEYMEEDIHKYADLIRSGEHTAILHASISLKSEQSLRYVHILQPAGFSDELRAVLVSGGACWGYLTLYRKTGRSFFTEEERLFIQASTSSIASMLRSTSLTLMDEITSESPSEPGILITSDTFQLLSVNAPAQYWLSQLRMLEHIGPDILPRPVRAVSSHLQRQTRTDRDVTVAQEAAHGSPSKVCIQLLDGRYLALHASLMQQPAGPDQIAIRLEQAMPQDLLPLLAESHGLSIRERELLGYVLRSYSSKEIASAMHISVYTVQDHLKSIFAKTDVSSRRELIWYFVSRFQLSDEHSINRTID
ncbi:helix-turn-helix transcriptional regulator [Paenibacillus sp. QZ-Y1]|uniref:helix-turn-helix transcriptional regulator n=1 Tax=Paenibacillus sp. QZ-Y1 TaxID=3414511 RepID=UPI003F7AA1D2